MAAQKSAARKQSPSKSKKSEDTTSDYEKELAGYLQERIKPGLNQGSIPLLARSIAKEIARKQQANGASEEPEEQDEPTAEVEDEQDAQVEDEPTDEAEDDVEEDEPTDEAGDEPEDDVEEDEPEDEPEDEVEPEDAEGEAGGEADFEADMRDLQAELGDEWVVRFSVKGDEAWLTAEKADGSQHVEAQTADTLLDAVELLEEGGGREG